VEGEDKASASEGGIGGGYRTYLVPKAQDGRSVSADGRHRPGSDRTGRHVLQERKRERTTVSGPSHKVNEPGETNEDVVDGDDVILSRPFSELLRHLRVIRPAAPDHARRLLGGEVRLEVARALDVSTFGDIGAVAIRRTFRQHPSNERAREERTYLASHHPGCLQIQVLRSLTTTSLVSTSLSAMLGESVS
jgi:hypothetical protein